MEQVRDILDPFINEVESLQDTLGSIDELRQPVTPSIELSALSPGGRSESERDASSGRSRPLADIEVPKRAASFACIFRETPPCATKIVDKGPAAGSDIENVLKLLNACAAPVVPSKRAATTVSVAPPKLTKELLKEHDEHNEPFNKQTRCVNKAVGFFVHCIEPACNRRALLKCSYCHKMACDELILW